MLCVKKVGSVTGLGRIEQIRREHFVLFINGNDGHDFALDLTLVTLVWHVFSKSGSNLKNVC